MARLKKEVVKPGFYPVGDRVIRVTEQDINNWVLNHKEITSKGYKVPLPWEHPSRKDAAGFPMTDDQARTMSRQKAKLNAGWVERLYVDETGTLQAELNVPLKRDAVRLKEVGTYVSPQFGRWTAPDGTKYERAMTHLALTPTPVSRDQGKSFSELPAKTVVAMSQINESSVRLSLGEMLTQEQLGDPMLNSFSPPMNDNDDDKHLDDEDPDDRGKGKQKKVTKAELLRQALAKHNIIIPDGVTVSGDLNTFIAGIDSAFAAKNNGMGGNGQPYASTGQINEEPMVITMSQPNGTPKPAPTVEILESRLEQMSQQNKLLMARSTESDRDRLRQRINGAFESGRCDVVDRDELLALVDQYQFSLESPEGTTEVAIRLKQIERLPSGAVWSDESRLKNMSVSVEQGRNSAFFTGNEMDPAAEEAAVKEQLSRAGH